jgi:hypothetical protein
MIFRVYPPYDMIRWPDGTTYQIHPPLNMKKSKKWVYTHVPQWEEQTDGTAN